MNRYTRYTNNMEWMHKLDENENTDYEVWIKEEDVKFMKKQLRDIEECLVKGEGPTIIRLIIERPRDYYDKAGRMIAEGDIICIDNIGVFEIRDNDSIVSVKGDETVFAFLENSDCKTIKVIGRTV